MPSELTSISSVKTSYRMLIYLFKQGVGTPLKITRKTLFEVIVKCGPTLRKLEIMTPWSPSPHSPQDNMPRFFLDEALKHCPCLAELTVAGFDVSDAFFTNLNSTARLWHLGITDFELVSPGGLQLGLKQTPFHNLKQLAVWQRNAGRSNDGGRVTQGW
jgi:hypothetical protein